MIYAYITGGGTKWIYDSLKRGGASKWFLGARIPYLQSDFDEMIGGKPFDGKYVSERTAAQLSMAALHRARKITNSTDFSIKGLGVTAKLGTKGQRKGRENKIICAMSVDTPVGFETYVKEFEIPAWLPRRFQEFLGGVLISKFVRDYKNSRNIYCERDFLTFTDLNSDGKARSVIIYSGSFNPFHKGHNEIYRTCQKLFKSGFYCEISLENFSKGYISPLEFTERKRQALRDFLPPTFIVSRSSTFLEKAEKLRKRGYKNIVFAVGDDTYERVTEEEKDKLHAMGARFLVFLRGKEKLDCQHKVIHKSTYKLPKITKISSSEIRGQIYEYFA